MEGWKSVEQWKRLTDGQSQRRTAEIRGLGMAVVVSLATNLDALSLLVCLVLCASVLSRIYMSSSFFYVLIFLCCLSQNSLKYCTGVNIITAIQSRCSLSFPSKFFNLSRLSWILPKHNLSFLNQAAASMYFCSAFFWSSLGTKTGTLSWWEGTLQAL